MAEKRTQIGAGLRNRCSFRHAEPMPMAVERLDSGEFVVKFFFRYFTHCNTISWTLERRFEAEACRSHGLVKTR